MKKRKKAVVCKRPVAVFAVICAMFAAVAARIAYLQTGVPAPAAAAADERKIEIAVSRGYIYDRTLQPLVNTQTENVAAVLLNEKTRTLLKSNGYNLIQNAEQMQSGICVTFRTNDPVKETACSVNIPVVQRYAGAQLCPHIVGYTDAEGRGVCGIEKSYDKVLSDASGTIGVRYTANGRGTALAGEGLRVENDGYDNAAGVVLTIDKQYQQIVQRALAASNITRGAVVVLEVNTGAVLAMASVPAFHINDLERDLENADLPFLNRALAAYPVGSVFKPFVAAAALENGVDCPQDYYCEGSTDVSGLTFRCFNGTSHGLLDLSGAIEKSCNGYFINLGRQIGAQALVKTAADFGFGTELRLTGDLHGTAGRLPSAEELASPGALANICFGQGELLATPLQMAAAFAAVANGGTYHTPFILKSLVDANKNEYAAYKNTPGWRAASEETCKTIGACLRQNMQEGTGKNGESDLITAAGKTATAQTGDVDENGNERLCTWFCGYFPYEEPTFCVVVFNENGHMAAEDCAPVFRAVTEGIYRVGMPQEQQEKPLWRRTADIR